MEDRKIVKFWIALGLIVAFYCVAACVHVHAYDEIPLEFNWIYKKDGDSAVYTWNNGYAYNIEGLNFIGMECGFPVPHYAGDGQYSLYFHFKFTCDQSPKPLFRMVISPYDSRLSLYPNTSADNYITNQLGSSNLFGELDQYNANLKSYYGTFHWMQKSGCNFQWVCMREKSPDYTNQYTYSVIGIMDLRLMEEDEMSPFRLGIEIANAQSYSTFTVYNVDMGISAMDSSSTWALYDIWNKLDEFYDDWDGKIDIIASMIGSQLGDLDLILEALQDLDFSDPVVINKLTAILNSIDGQNESLFDDNETDEDLTEWENQASDVADDVAQLHDIEESLIGSLSSFEFPTAGTYTEVERSFFDFWFLDPIITPMILTGLALMIAFMIL